MKLSLRYLVPILSVLAMAAVVACSEPTHQFGEPSLTSEQAPAPAAVPIVKTAIPAVTTTYGPTPVKGEQPTFSTENATGRDLAVSLSNEIDMFRNRAVEIRNSARSENTFKEISAGAYHTCGVRESGEAVCWGNNEDGKSSPPDGRFKAISAGTFHTCGLRENGKAVCWGSNEDNMSTPPEGRFIAISAAGLMHVSERGEELLEDKYKNGITCGLRSNGTVHCWGSLKWNGIGSVNSDALDLDGTFKQISTGFTYVCGLREDGSVSCSGSHPPPSGTFKAITAGSFHKCGLKENGEAVCKEGWEDDYSFARGEKLIALSARGGWDSVKDAHVYRNDQKIYRQKNRTICGIREDGTPVCAGVYGFSEDDNTYKSISTGVEHACALRVDGVVKCWGLWSRAADPPSGDIDRLEEVSKKWLSEADVMKRGVVALESAVDVLPKAMDYDNNVSKAAVTALANGITLLMEAANNEIEAAVSHMEKANFHKDEEAIEIVSLSSHVASSFAKAADDLNAVTLTIDEDRNRTDTLKKLSQAAQSLYDGADSLSNDGGNADPLYDAADSLQDAAGN